MFYRCLKCLFFDALNIFFGPQAVLRSLGLSQSPHASPHSIVFGFPRSTTISEDRKWPYLVVVDAGSWRRKLGPHVHVEAVDDLKVTSLIPPTVRFRQDPKKRATPAEPTERNKMEEAKNTKKNPKMIEIFYYEGSRSIDSWVSFWTALCGNKRPA